MAVQGGAGQVDRGRLGLKALSVLVELLSLIPEQSFERLAPEMKQLMEAIAHATVVLGSTYPAGVCKAFGGQCWSAFVSSRCRDYGLLLAASFPAV